MVVIEELGITFLFLVIGFLLAMRLRLPPVIGVLLAGAIIGPNGFALIKQSETINAFADIGATLLLFVIGVEFSLSKIIRFGFRALLMTIVKLAISFIVVYELALLFGMGSLEAMVLGALFSITSTTIFSKLIKNQTLLGTEEISLLFAVLIIEDVIAVFILTFISSLPTTAGLDSTQLVFSMVKSLTILVMAYIILQNIITKLFGYIARMKSNETLVFAAFTTAALFALLANLIGLQPSIGAFLAGSLISSLREFKKIENTLVPFGLFFSSFFFLSIGMLVSFDTIARNWLLILLLVAVSIIAKFASVSISVYTLKKNGRSAIFAGLTMLSVGEFSLLISKEAAKFVTFDIIGLAASAVFLTSLISAVLISTRASVEGTVLRIINPAVRDDGRKVAIHVSRILGEIEPGGELFNIYITELKNLIIYAATFIIINGALYLIAEAIEGFHILDFSEGTPFMVRAVLHIAAFILFGIIAFNSIDRIVTRTIMTFSIVDRKNVELDKKLFYSAINLVITMILFFITPVLVSMLRLPDFFSHLAVIPLAIASLILWSMLKTLQGTVISNGENKKYTRRF